MLSGPEAASLEATLWADLAGYERISYAAELLISPEDTIALFAELSLVLAGFAGVVSAFSGRDRQFRPTEHIRLTHILSCSATVLAGSLGFLIGSAGELEASQALSFAGAVACPLAAVLLLPLTRRAWANARDPDSTTEKSVVLAIPILNTSVVLLFGLAAFLANSFFLLVLAFSIQMMIGLWLFARLLMRPN